MKKKLIFYICIFLLLIFSNPLSIYGSELITNPSRSDGFGAQFQTIIYSIIYAELNNKQFVYTPFQSMEHNYNNEPEFLNKKEWLVNLQDFYPINRDLSLQRKYSQKYFIKFFESNLVKCSTGKALQDLKKIFRLNKDIQQYYDPKRFNIAVHIRRPNTHDCRLAGADTPDKIFLSIMDKLRQIHSNKNPLFHIYSQGDVEEFRKIYPKEDIVFHINGQIEDTFTSLVLADVLVTSPSSFSYTAGLLSNGQVFYIPFLAPSIA